MPVKRELWHQPLSSQYMPNWHCPICNGGYLRLKSDSLHFLETSASRKAPHSDWIEYRFSALVICNNKQCQEPATVSGHGRLEIVQTSSAGDFDEVKFFYPLYVNPSPMLIPIPKDCPDAVTTELQQAFLASWSDFSSAANHVRSGVERLLDYLKEPKTKLSNAGKRECLSLHQRIGNLATRDKELSESLLAVKWLGNIGSHSDDLSRKDIFDAFDILEVILDDLFVRHRARVKKLVSVINKKKGPTKK